MIRASSVVAAAGRLHGKLLIAHGLMDDNVHAQNSMQLIQALQRADKPFEVMVYPRNRHRLGGKFHQRLTIDFMGINAIMWGVLLAGAYVTVAFTYLFGFERTVMQQLMIGGLSLIIGLVLFFTLALYYPFRGSIAVGPGAFRELLADWSANAATEPPDLQTPAASK